MKMRLANDFPPRQYWQEEVQAWHGYLGPLYQGLSGRGESVTIVEVECRMLVV